MNIEVHCYKTAIADSKFVKKSRLALHCLTIFFALLPVKGMANILDDIRFAPSVSFQYKHLSFDQDYPTGLGSQYPQPFSGGIDAQLPMVSLGASAIILSDFFLTLFVDRTLSEANESSSVPFTNPISNSPTVLETNTSVDREDYNLAIGYQATAKLTLFLGYIDGQTTLTPDAVNSNIAEDQRNAGFGQYQQTYQEKGQFLGINYILFTNDLGALSVRLAGAFMDGEYTDNYYDQAFRFEGNSNGASAALKWNQALTEELSYNVGFNLQSYEFKGRDKTGVFPNNRVITQETISALSLGLLWRL